MQSFKVVILLLLIIGNLSCKKNDEKIAAANVLVIKSAPSKIELTDIFFINANVGFVVGRPSYILKTNNGGKTWFKLYPDTNKYNNYEYIYFIDSMKGCVRYNGYISYTADGGLNWNLRDTTIKGQISRQYKKERPNVGQYVLKNIGIEVNIPDVTRYGSIKRSVNYGKTWNYVETGIKNNLRGMAFKDSADLILVGDNALWKSYDAGASWIYYRNQDGESVDLLMKATFVGGGTYFAISKTNIYSINFPY